MITDQDLEHLIYDENDPLHKQIGALARAYIRIFLHAHDRDVRKEALRWIRNWPAVMAVMEPETPEPHSNIIHVEFRGTVTAKARKAQ